MTNQDAPSTQIALPTASRIVQPSRASIGRLYVESRTTENSRKTATAALKRVAKLVTGKSDPYALPFEALTPAAFEQIKARLTENYAPATVNNTLSVIRGVMKLAWREGRVQHDQYRRIVATEDIKNSTPPAGRDVKASEMVKLYAAISSESEPRQTRDRAMLAILQHGLRVSELCKLEVSDLVDERLTVRKGKGNKTRVVHLHPDALAALQAWLEIDGKPDTGALFNPIDAQGRIRPRALGRQAVYLWIKDLTTKAGVEHFSPHDLRRTFVGDMFDAGVDAATIARIVGHEQINTTQRYDRRDSRAESAAVSKLKIPM